MKIQIDYESSWRNSFLDGSNDDELPKNGRKFIASVTNLKDEKNYIRREVTLNTVMGIMNRLIGDQRKLYQARKDPDYYFHNIESSISFDDHPLITNEMTFIRNISGSNDQNSFTGMIKTNDVIFQSNFSQELWGVLALSFDELINFIVNATKKATHIELDAISISNKFDDVKKIKPVEKEGLVETAVNELGRHFSATNYLNNKGQVVPSTVYCSAIYLQLSRLSERFDISAALTKNGTLPGISKRIFTKKDFMNRFTTGEKKKIWGNPYMREVFIKGEGKQKFLMSKASGSLEINIDISRDKARELKRLIKNAGVSSFYLGKKGLAYVTNIDSREVRK